jgi:hypothetical protein
MGGSQGQRSNVLRHLKFRGMFEWFGVFVDSCQDCMEERNSLGLEKAKISERRDDDLG